MPFPVEHSALLSNMKEILLVFCVDLQKDPVSARVLERMLELRPFEPTGLELDGRPVLSYSDGKMTFNLLRLDNVLSHAYERYSASINDHFSLCEAVVIVNWHEGAKAPNSIFTVQTTGDMKSGHFSRVDPRITRALFLSIEETRKSKHLDAFTTWMEATHWSGVVYGEQPGEYVSRIRPSVIDVEIGSCQEDWGNPLAADVMASALLELSHYDDATPVSLLCLGGIHFEPGFTNLIKDYGASQRIALSHILPNHWLVSNGYEDPSRLPSLLACGESITGGVDAVVYHDNLKGSLKQQARQLALRLGVPLLSHKKLRSPDISSVIRTASEGQ
jgi:D-tyrosyl-tRNA(Tyr) deacylase